MEDYQSQESAIAAKARKNGITTQELNAVFERMLENVTREHGGKSVGFRLGKAEGLVWGHFFPGEPFPTVKPVTSSRKVVQYSDDPISPFPKAVHSKSQPAYEAAARREWVHDRYRPESPGKIDSYRPKIETDFYRPGVETGASRSHWIDNNRPPRRPESGYAGPGSELYKKREAAFIKELEEHQKKEKERGALEDLSTNGNTRRVEKSIDADPFTSSSKEGSNIYQSQAKVIQKKARDAGISMFKIEDCFEEKAAIARKKFGDCSRDWRMYFVEASVWGRYFTSPFPGNEPPKHIAKGPVKMPKEVSAGTAEEEKSMSEFAAQRKDPKLSPYVPRLSEAHMEALAIQQGRRKEFFKCLEKMRMYTSFVHKDDACIYIKGWFADNLTWQEIFGPKPFPFAQPYGKRNLKLAPLAKQKEDNSAKDPAVNTANKGEAQPTATLLPTRSVTDANTAPLQAGPGLPISRPAQDVQSTYVQTPGAPASRRSLRTPPPGLLSPVALPRAGADFHTRSTPPLHMTTLLAQMWARDPFLGKGTVVMQNATPAIYNKTFIGELFSCFLSDKKQAIDAIGAELKCTIHYYVTSTGDLFLWTEPVTPGDTVSFGRGHMFITGWVTRVASFGMVKPSVHWNAIRIPLAPLQTKPPPILQPLDTADTLRRLSSYVQAATNDQNNQPVTNKSESTKPGLSTGIESSLADAQMHDTPVPQSELEEPNSTIGPEEALPSGCEDPERQWERYKLAFRTSDIDRLMVEEAAKNEGDLRMVIDKETGQIVSVEELVKRTVHRCGSGEGNGANKITDKGTVGGDNSAVGNDSAGGLNEVEAVGKSVGSKKRKSDYDDVEDGRQEKRTCV
ncbi:hypothetical protein VTL71DRAFT_9839 [Oculimacula yallundae]|uniref:Uncharacterized protein n=1 Tax=Oculimacula yallundae TaxID=86028 RepID=A0ABR4BRI5_9HELO